MKRTMGAMVVATLVSAGTAVYALAGHEPGPIQSITGCLTSTAKLVKLKLGDEPKGGSCGAQTEVHLSGGDITAVLPGYGLSPRSGGTQGSATLDVDATVIQNRVLKDCGVGAAISQIHEDGSVDCDRDDGFRNRELVKEESESDSTDVKLVLARCPPGTVAVGGGATALPLGRATIVMSMPDDDPEPGWLVMAAEFGVHNLSWKLEAHAVCADVD